MGRHSPSYVFHEWRFDLTWSIPNQTVRINPWPEAQHCNKISLTIDENNENRILTSDAENLKLCWNIFFAIIADWAEQLTEVIDLVWNSNWRGTINEPKVVTIVLNIMQYVKNVVGVPSQLSDSPLVIVINLRGRRRRALDEASWRLAIWNRTGSGSHSETYILITETKSNYEIDNRVHAVCWK